MTLFRKIHWIVLAVVAMFGLLPVCHAQTDTSYVRGQPVAAAVFVRPANLVDSKKYKYLEECQHAVVRIIDSVTRDVLVDTARYQITDTLPTVVVQAAQQCLARFSPASVPLFQLPILLNLAIQGKDETMIRAVVATQSASADTAPVRVRAFILQQAVDELLKAKPANVLLAREFAAQADLLGDEALYVRVLIRQTLRTISMYHGDLDSLVAQSRVLIDWMRKTPLKVVPELMRGTFETVELPYAEQQLSWFQYLRDHDEKDFSRYIALGQNLPWGSLTGQSVPPLVGDFWFDTAGKDAQSVAVPGRISLVVFVNPDHPGIQIRYGYAMLRRLQKQFPEIRIFLASATRGYFRDVTLPLSAEREATLLHHYFSDSLSLPGVLSISKRSYLKHDTGILLPLPVANESVYDRAIDYSLNRTFLIDRMGRIVNTFSLYGSPDFKSTAEENMLVTTIASLLRQPMPVRPSVASDKPSGQSNP